MPELRGRATPLSFRSSKAGLQRSRRTPRWSGSQRRWELRSILSRSGQSSGGLLVTGTTPAFVRAELTGGRGAASVADTEALWWPPGKIVGRYLAPFLAVRAETSFESPVQSAR
jgi:hypothetical protein